MIVLIFLVLFFVVLVMMIQSEISCKHSKWELEETEQKLFETYRENKRLQDDIDYYKQICDDRAKTIDDLWQMIHDLQEKK